jgi:hypothetical protein
MVEAQHFGGLARLEGAAEELKDENARRKKMDDALSHLQLAIAPNDKQNSDLIFLAAASYDVGRYDDCTKYANRYLDAYPSAVRQRLSPQVQAFLVIGDVWSYLSTLRTNSSFGGSVASLCHPPMPGALPLADAQLLDKLLLRAFGGFMTFKFADDKQRGNLVYAYGKSLEFLRGSTALGGCSAPHFPPGVPVPPGAAPVPEVDPRFNGSPAPASAQAPAPPPAAAGPVPGPPQIAPAPAPAPAPGPASLPEEPAPKPKA